MPDGAHWQDVATENRVRIEALEKEIDRHRERLHTIAQNIAPVTYLAQQVGSLTTELHEMSKRLETLARRAVEKPTPSGVSAVAGLGNTILALVALVIALTR